MSALNSEEECVLSISAYLAMPFLILHYCFTHYTVQGLYVLGFHPHGIVPITLFWLRCCSDWENLFPGVAFSPLTASVMHLVPLMRDLLQVRTGTYSILTLHFATPR